MLSGSYLEGVKIMVARELQSKLNTCIFISGPHAMHSTDNKLNYFYTSSSNTHLLNAYPYHIFMIILLRNAYCKCKIKYYSISHCKMCIQVQKVMISHCKMHI